MVRNRGGGWKPLGAGIEPESLLPRRRARELRWRVAWEAAAGERAAWGRLVRIQRGTLEVEATDPERFAALAEGMNEIARRMRAAHPPWDIRRFVVRHGEREYRGRVDPP